MRHVIYLFLIFILFACAKEHAKQEKSSQLDILKPCPSFSETGKPALVYGAECGTLAVKENPTDPRSREITLNILRLPAISPTAKKDPLFLIQGGPGGSSVRMAEMVHYAFAEVRKNRDLIFIDQRGTGKSNPLDCEKIDNNDEELAADVVKQKMAARIKTCAEEYKDQSIFYTTPYAVQDIELVRRALGYPSINLWGVSYGSRVALEYAREFSATTRTIILDGVAPVQMALPKYFAEDAMSALRVVNDECAAQEKCKQQFGDVIEKADKVSARLAQAEDRQAPIKIEFKHPLNQTIKKITLSQKIFSQLIFMSLYSRDLTVLLPQAIADSERGDYQLIASLFTLASEQNGFANISEGMRYSVVCNEDAYFIAPEDIDSGNKFFGINMLKEMAEECKIWPKSILPKIYFDPIKSDLPALLLSGVRDPVTPPRWAQEVARHLPNSLQLVAQGGNHSISMEGCLPKIIAQFIELASVNKLNTSCVNDIKPLPLVLGANENKASANPASQASATQSSVGGEQK